MLFKDALIPLADGEPMSRAAWADGGQIHLKHDLFHFTDDNGTSEVYELTTEDILAGDWSVVTPDITESTAHDPWA